MRIRVSRPHEKRTVPRSITDRFDPSVTHRIGFGTANDVEPILDGITEVPFADRHGVITSGSQRIGHQRLIGRQRQVQFRGAGVVRIPRRQDRTPRRRTRRTRQKRAVKTQTVFRQRVDRRRRDVADRPAVATQIGRAQIVGDKYDKIGRTWLRRDRRWGFVAATHRRLDANGDQRRSPDEPSAEFRRGPGDHVD